MARSAGWLQETINRIKLGCENSPYIGNLQNELDMFTSGRVLCHQMWPFVSSLPGNVSLVLKSLPDQLQDARKLFEQLSDQDGYYRGLYRKQCFMAGIKEESLDKMVPSEATNDLCQMMYHHCTSGNYVDGVLAIVTAELGATIYARHTYGAYISFFSKYPSAHPDVSVQDGMEWLRLHAKPHPRHAIWMKRTIDSIEPADSAEQSTPRPVVEITDAFLSFLQNASPVISDSYKEIPFRTESGSESPVGAGVI